MFKKFVKMIIAAENKQDAINNVFYGKDGVDMMFQRGKISFEDHQILLALIEKMV